MQAWQRAAAVGLMGRRGWEYGGIGLTLLVGAYASSSAQLPLGLGDFAVALVILLAAAAADAKLSRAFHCLLEEPEERNARPSLLRRLSSAVREPGSQGLWMAWLLLPLLHQSGATVEAALVLAWTAPALAVIAAQPFVIYHTKLLLSIAFFGAGLGLLFSLPVYADFLGPNYTLSGLVVVALLCTLLTLPLWTLAVLAAPKSLSLGEAALLGEGLLLLFLRLATGKARPNSVSPELWTILTAAAWATLYAVTAGCLCCRRRRRPWLVLLNLAFAVSAALVYTCLVQGLNLPVIALRLLQAGGKRRVCVLVFWLLCLLASGLFVLFAFENKSDKVTTIHRKFFHLTAGLVLWSGLLFDPELTFFGSAISACVLCLLELCRASRVLGDGDVLSVALSRFVDRQDQGPLLLTPLYLLFALFVPLWMDPVREPSSVRLWHYAGLIAVGWADSAAAVGGLTCGRRRWPCVPSKTVEGTLAGAAAGLIGALLAVESVSSISSSGGLAWLCLVSLLISGLETVLCQIDNLALPLFAYILLRSPVPGL